MARPLRIEFPGAIYHVTSRGNRREPIFRDDADRELFLQVLGQTLERFNAQVLAYCLMGNHYHLVLHTLQANLSRLMRQLNGVYTQSFNRRHRLAGHLFQGRFKAILVDRDAYLLALCRYVERNPVAAGVVQSADDWPWSSYRAHVCKVAGPTWLDSEGLHGHMLGRAPTNAADRRRAAVLYAASVAQNSGADADLWLKGMRQQVFLGDEAFVERMLQHTPATATKPDGVPKLQKRRPTPVQQAPKVDPKDPRRAFILRAAYTEDGWRMTQIAQANGLSISRVSRLIRSAESGAKDKT